MNFGEDLELDADNDVVGADTGRVVAKFSHHAEAESFVKFYNNQKKQIAEITSLREQLEIAKKDGWISVDTALPDDCDEYAVWMLDTITQQEYFTTSHLNPAKTGFYVDYIDDDTPREQVTHWQPLPEPPKE